MKNRPGNKVLAEPNVIWNSMKTQKINKSHKLKMQYILYCSQAHLLPVRSCLKPKRLVSENYTFLTCLPWISFAKAIGETV